VSNCKNHQDQPSAYECLNCKNVYCEPCVSVRRITGDFTAYVCKDCGGKCEPLNVIADERKAKAARDKTIAERKAFEKKDESRRPMKTKRAFEPNFFLSLCGSIFFPLKGRGFFITLLAPGFFWGLDKFLPADNSLGLLAWVAVMTFFSIYLFRVVEQSLDGKNRLPGLPDLKYWLWMAKPSILVGLTFFICFAPGNIYFLLRQKLDFIFVFLLGTGLFLFPMFLIKIILSEKLSDINPWAVLRAIAKTFFPYFASCIFLGGLVGVFYYCNLEFFAGYRDLGLGLKSLLMVYIAFVQARVLGVFGRYYRNKLG